MATIVNNPGPSERVVERNSDSGGWAIAVVILVIVIAGIFLWMRYYRAPAPDNSGGVNVDVTLPAGSPDAGSGGPAETGPAGPAAPTY
jgi:hypothetical protein